jgi:hypothetical protein
VHAAVGLFVAWVIHDLEEAMTMPATADRLASRLDHSPRSWVRLLARHTRMDGRRATLAIALMGVLVAAATVHGIATDGRSRFFQYVLAGLHGHVCTHVGLSLRLRGYTSGVFTALAVMAPYSRAARRALRDAQILIEGPRPYVLGAVILLPAALASHVIADLLVRHQNGH